MASSITSAGVASGMDFESIITAMVAAKKSRYDKGTTLQKETTKLEISGVAALKNALKKFQDNVSDLTKAETFNARKVNINQPSDPIFSISTNNDAANMDLNIAVLKTATTEKASQTFKLDGNFKNSFAQGSLEIDLGPDENGKERKFTVDIAQGDSLENIRKKINENNFGLTVNLVKGDSGYSFSIDTGKTGVDGSNLSIKAINTQATADNDSLELFNLSQDNTGNYTHTKGQNAQISVNDQILSSKTNTFENLVSGVTITVNKVSEKAEAKDNSVSVDGVQYKSYTATISQDTDAVAKKVESFVNAYNDLVKSLDALSARNTYTDGKNNYDGGALAGDSTVNSLKAQLATMVSSFSTTSNGMSIFDMGLKLEKDGKLSFESSDFKTALKDNYNSVVKLFSDEKDGLLNKLDSFANNYTKSQGTLDNWTDSLNKELSQIEQKELKNTESLSAYEASLRKRYAKLDTLMASNNNALNSLNNILTSLQNSKKNK